MFLGHIILSRNFAVPKTCSNFGLYSALEIDRVKTNHKLFDNKKICKMGILKDPRRQSKNWLCRSSGLCSGQKRAENHKYSCLHKVLPAQDHTSVA